MSGRRARHISEGAATSAICGPPDFSRDSGPAHLESRLQPLGDRWRMAWVLTAGRQRAICHHPPNDHLGRAAAI